MRLDPMESWRQLTRHYAEMSDSELMALAEDFRDLTDTARQVLRDEMRKRNLGDPQSLASAEQQPVAPSDSGFAAPTGAGASRAGKQSVIFVWKNTLCDCRDSEEAWQISEVLRRAGIESWLDSSQTYYTPLPEMGSSAPRPRILVAADDLDAARAILARPIPRDIVEQSKAEHAEYNPPVCPRCGAPDPLLEGADPSNSWKCEVCGRQWIEAVEPAGEPPLPG